MTDLTDEQCDEFRRLPCSFNDMVRAIYKAGAAAPQQQRVSPGFIGALERRDAQQQAEPVAWFHHDHGVIELSRVRRVGWRPLYASPRITAAQVEQIKRLADEYADKRAKYEAASFDRAMTTEDWTVCNQARAALHAALDALRGE